MKTKDTIEVTEALIKISAFIELNKDINYKVRLLDREVPNLKDLVKKLTLYAVSDNEVALCKGTHLLDTPVATRCENCGDLKS